jgi:opacity protein-like surface antigen
MRFFKVPVLAGAIAVAIAGGAQAQETRPAFDWGGVYFGHYAGAVYIQDPFLDPFFGEMGLMGGFNVAGESVFGGVEIRTGLLFAGFPLPNSSVVGRIGFTSNRLAFYALGGVGIDTIVPYLAYGAGLEIAASNRLAAMVEIRGGHGLIDGLFHGLSVYTGFRFY